MTKPLYSGSFLETYSEEMSFDGLFPHNLHFQDKAALLPQKVAQDCGACMCLQAVEVLGEEDKEEIRIPSRDSTQPQVWG